MNTVYVFTMDWWRHQELGKDISDLTTSQITSNIDIRTIFLFDTLMSL